MKAEKLQIVYSENIANFYLEAFSIERGADEVYISFCQLAPSKNSPEEPNRALCIARIIFSPRKLHLLKNEIERVLHEGAWVTGI